MRSKRRTVLTVALAIVALVGALALAEPSDDRPYRILKDAARFSIGGAGYLGTTAREERAFRVVWNRPSASRDFRRLLSEATIAGQLYALLGLKLLGAPAFRTELPMYLASPTEVEEWAGCLVMRTSASEVGGAISRGEYDELAELRAARSTSARPSP